MERGQFYLFKVKGWKTPIGGVVELVGSEWILIKYIVVDYALDGYRLIRRKYINNYIHDEHVQFTEKVLLAKGIMDLRIPHSIPLDSQEAPFAWLKECDVTAQFKSNDDTICYVGKVGKMTKRFFQLISMNPRGNWDTFFYKQSYASISTIDFDSDYVSSLLIYNKKNALKKDAGEI